MTLLAPNRAVSIGPMRTAVGVGVLACVGAASVACSASDPPRGAPGAPAVSDTASTGPAPPPAPAPPSPEADASGPMTDSDGDGLPDALEQKYATEYMPFLSVHPNDGCRTHGLLYRIAPHPKEPSRVMMWVDVLYDEDCGANGHPGDDEMFAVVVDPTKPAPDGILALRAISHQGTPCEHTTTCGRCTGMSACSTGDRAGKAFPAVYPSKDKHGNYADKPTCDGSFVCDFGGCGLASSPDAAPALNAGEPTHPLVHDLTTDGFVTAANGWKQAVLMHFDPWKAGNFGGAGDVSRDLVDPSFVIDTTACR